MKTTVLSIILMTLFLAASAQSNSVGNGYYEMILPKKYDKINIEKECVEKAQLKAMENVFGKVMSQSNNSSQQATNMGGQSTSTASFTSSSVSFVTGRWVKDLAPPEIEYYKSKGKNWIAVTVKGEVKQLTKEEIAANPETAFDYFSLAVEAYESGNTRKTLTYLESYVEKEAMFFIEPHLLFIELMNDEDRQSDLTNLYAKNSNKYSPEIKELLSILSMESEEKIKLSKLFDLSHETSNVLIQLISAKMLIKLQMDLLQDSEQIGKEIYCKGFRFSDEFDDVLKTKYYKNNVYFLSQFSKKSFLSLMDINIIKNYGTFMSATMKPFIEAIPVNNQSKSFPELHCKTKEEARESVYKSQDTMNKAFVYSCCPEYRDSVFDKLWIDLDMANKL